MPASNQYCESCLMPFAKDPGARESERYCSFCFSNGALCYPGDDLKTFQRYAYQGMIERNIHPVMAKVYTFIIRFAPRWKK